MDQLTGNAIHSSYLGLFKTTDNAAVGATEKQITDGAGNNVPLTLGTAGISFTGGADFTGATVTGLPGGGTNFVGTGWTLSTQSAADLVREVIYIPGGTYGVGDVLSVQGIEYRDGLNNWGYSSIWISDTAQTVGLAPAGGANNFSLAQYQSPSSRSRVIYNKTLFITSSGTFCMPVQQSTQNSGDGGDQVEIYNINWANDQYFFHQFYNDSTTGSIQTSGHSIHQRS